MTARAVHVARDTRGQVRRGHPVGIVAPRCGARVADGSAALASPYWEDVTCKRCHAQRARLEADA